MNNIPQHIIDSLNNLSCEDVANKLGLQVVKHKTLCFMHDDHHPSLGFYGENRERWWCYVCNKGGRSISFVKEYLGVGFIEACLWLGTQFNISIDNNLKLNRNINATKRKRYVHTNDIRPFSRDVAQWILDNNCLANGGKRFLIGERKLSPVIIKRLNIISIEDSKALLDELRNSFDQKTLLDSGFVTMTNNRMYLRMFTPCLVFPYYDRNGILVGVQSRYIGDNDEAPRFQFLSAQKTRLFNLPILNTVNYGEDLYISEGITDCLALLSAGKKAVAIPSATILPKNDLLDLAIYKLHMYPDKDDAGRKAYLNLRRYFINHYAIIKEEMLPDGVKDYSELFIFNHGTNE